MWQRLTHAPFGEDNSVRLASVNHCPTLLFSVFSLVSASRFPLPKTKTQVKVSRNSMAMLSLKYLAFPT